MPKTRVSLLAAIAVTILAVSEGHAQSAQKVSLQFSGLSAVLFGDEFQGVNPGYGGEAQLRYTPSIFSLGGGFQFTSHGTDLQPGDFGSGVSLTNKPRFKLFGGFLEPRIVIPAHSNYVAPYLSTRFSVLTEKADLDVEVFDDLGNSLGMFAVSASATGFTINGGGGLLFRLGRRVNLDVGATVGWTDFGEAKLEIDNQEVGRFPSSAGGNVVFRVGLAVGLGG